MTIHGQRSMAAEIMGHGHAVFLVGAHGELDMNTFSSCSLTPPVVVSFDLFVLPTRDGHLRTKEEQNARARETSKVKASVKVVSTA